MDLLSRCAERAAEAAVRLASSEFESIKAMDAVSVRNAHVADIVGRPLWIGAPAPPAASHRRNDGWSRHHLLCGYVIAGARPDGLL